MDPRTSKGIPSVADQARHLGDTLRARRKVLGVNMTAAADAAGISRITWHRLEKGEPTVAWGSMLAAAMVVGMELKLNGARSENKADDSEAVGQLPLRISLSEFPGLRRLAWQVGDRVDVLTPREALGLYMRNSRHLDLETLLPRERSLMRALQDVFAARFDGTART